MEHFDITQTNRAVERLLDVTDNPRHRYLLAAYNRHRYLEMAGRYEELLAPVMTVEHPVYASRLIGRSFMLDGGDAGRGALPRFVRHLSVRLLRRGRGTGGWGQHDRQPSEELPAVPGSALAAWRATST